MDLKEKIYVAGHQGMVGSAILRKLKAEGYENFALRTSAELDLRNQNAVREFFEKEKPFYVFLAAAKVGGILANNSYRADFLLDNLLIQNNVIYQSFKNGVRKLMFLGSSCIYPKMAPQPLKEEYLLTGSLESTNEPYAIAKIAGLKLCEAFKSQYGSHFFSVMPTNLYGINDNYHPLNSHVLPSLIRRFHEAKLARAKEVVVWGTGEPLREFMFADDLAEACFFLMNHAIYEPSINIGTGQEITIRDLAYLIRNIVGFSGDIVFDNTKPNGTPRKLLDVEKLKNLGYRYKVELADGIKIAYQDYLQNPKYSILHQD